MTDSKVEGKAEALPMYSIQADVISNKDVEEYCPYTMTTNLNPCAEGLEDPVLVQEESEANEGIDADRDDNNIRLERSPSSDAPGCCRRYSCCFPLIITTLVWLMMISAEAFEHCQDCVSTKHEYMCSIEQRADYYCKSEIIQVCCYYDGDNCRTIEYPEEMQYSMGKYFSLSMCITIIICLLPCIVPIGIPMMLYFDCRNIKFSIKRQTYFDILCTLCFIGASLGCSWTIWEYYRYPQNRCSTNSELFGISMDNDDILRQPNIWIMSQTTYSSFFGFILLCSFSICGTLTLTLQRIAKKKKHAAIDDPEE